MSSLLSQKYASDLQSHQVFNCLHRGPLSPSHEAEWCLGPILFKTSKGTTLTVCVCACVGMKNNVLDVCVVCYQIEISNRLKSTKEVARNSSVPYMSVCLWVG